jgi:hypothetical protein
LRRAIVLEARILGGDTLILVERNLYERLDIFFVTLGVDAFAQVSREMCREVVAFLVGLEKSS